MQIIDTDTDLTRYIIHVMDVIREALEKSTINDLDALAVMIHIAEFDTKEELEEKVEALLIEYPFLKEVAITERIVEKEKIDELLQRFVSMLIKDGKTDEAVAIGKLAHKQGITLDAIKSSYPDFKLFLEN